MTDYIQGHKFQSIADFTYAPIVKHGDDYDNLKNTFLQSKLKDLNVVYTHTMYVKQLFQLIKIDLRKFIVISHNSDVNIDESFIVPKNVLKWHSQNVKVTSSTVKSIPIGLENDRWFVKDRKKEKMQDRLSQAKGCRNWVYMNFNIDTNPKARQPVYDLFAKSRFVTVDMHKNGFNFDKYLDNIYHHRFVLCPRGNGMDTHRTWESLYMNTIPIEKRNTNNQFYKDLPICFVDSWEEITEEFLEREYIRIKSHQWKMEMLTFEYWKNKIRENDSVSA